jgi:hypothetical protein
MRFHFLIYFDPARVFDNSSESNALLARAGRHGAELEARGVMLAAYPLSLPRGAVTVHRQDGKTVETDGPFAEAREMLGGLCVIEAKDLDDAKRIAAEMPHAEMGHIEIRPEIDFRQPRPVVTT